MALIIRNRAIADAPPEVVWDILRDPSRWPDFALLLSDVEGGVLPLEAAQSLTVVGRAPVTLRVPVDIRVVHPLQRLGITIHTAPGVTELVDHLLVPLPGGRTDIEVRVEIRGPLAPLAYPFLRASSALATRALAAAASRDARGRAASAA